MPTPWTYPSNIVQFAEPGAEDSDVAWDSSRGFSELKNFDGKSLPSTGTLKHLARSPRPDIRNKTYFLRCTGFNFLNLPSVMSGIEVKVDSQRYGRVQDETIQLCLNDSLIGDNLSTELIVPQKIYGSETSVWNSGLTRDDIVNPSFGFTLRFQAHRHWPHNDSVFIDAIQMRIW